MTKMLEQAVEKVRELPNSVQDEAGEMLFSIAARQRGLIALDEETRSAVRAGRAQARRGEFASDDEMAAFFAQHAVKR